ncbi:MAG: MFS transporter, partial [Erysipelotrichaceae bacterium]|nr:MFS transporter [Erysipelotrichaceae bacterium]
SVKEMFKALLGNDQAMVLVVTIVLVNISIYITSNLVIYYFKYDFGGEGWSDAYTLFNTFGGATQILSMMLLYPLVRKFLSMKKVFDLCVKMAIGGFLVLLGISMINFRNLYVLFIPGFLIFAANGMITVLTTVFLADSVDYGQMKNGRRDESVIFSMQTFVVKLASGVAALLAALCLEIFNISDSTEVVANVAGGSLIGLRLTMTLLPLAGLAFAFYYFNKHYLLDEEKMAEIHDALATSGEQV